MLAPIVLAELTAWYMPLPEMDLWMLAPSVMEVLYGFGTGVAYSPPHDIVGL